MRGASATPLHVSPKRITSAIYAVFTVLAASFVVSSTYQIAVGVMAEPADGAAAGMPVKVAPACAEGVRTLAVAVDRGVAAAAGATSRADAESRYRAARGPDWDEAKQRELVEPCNGDARGADAVAAVSRLD